uniref:Galactose oxidase/kelch repeat superfamily protein n=1 Tax=Brassica oleracea TaxID=3712 RepID=A0A3P6FV71_BRAOL|nr:unnamed protein product [Brassica oleracea]
MVHCSSHGRHSTPLLLRRQNGVSWNKPLCLWWPETRSANTTLSTLMTRPKRVETANSFGRRTPPRSFHSMAADDKNVYVFGGVSSTTRVKTLDVYNIADKKWKPCATPGEAFSIRGGSGLEVVNGKVWVVYGFNNYEIDDIYCYDPVGDKWTKVETTGEQPSGRSVFASAVVGKHIVIFGGEVDMDPEAHVGPGQLMDGTFALDTETLKWERLDKLGVEKEVEGTTSGSSGLSIHLGIPTLLDVDLSIGNPFGGHKDKKKEEKQVTPEIRGWTASTSATINGKKGLLMHGGKAQTNDRFEDLFFYEFQ